MKIVEQTRLSAAQKSRIVELWNAEYPLALVYPNMARFDQYLAKLKNKRHFLLLDDNAGIIGWAMTFDREDDRWFAIIIDGKAQGLGGGRRLMNRLKETEDKLSGWVIDHNRAIKLNGVKYLSPLRFYEKIGFRVCRDERIESDKMSGVRIVWNAADFPAERLEKTP